VFKVYLVQVFNLLIVVPIIIITGLGVNALLPNVNQGIVFAFTVFLTAAVLLVIDAATAEFIKWKSMRTLKQYGFKTAGEAEKVMRDYTDYQTQLYLLPPEAKREIIDKSNRTEQLIKDYEGRPPFFFQNLGMTKEEAIEQVKNDCTTWLKQRGYPVWEFPLKNQDKS